MADQPINPGAVNWSGENPGKHYMASLFIPGQRAEVIVNSVRGVGKPIPRDMHGVKSTTAFLAFSETWVRG
jgi:hypothetical protein